MLSNDAFSYKVAQPGFVTAPLFKGVQYICALMCHLRVQRIFFVHFGIKIPAKITETLVFPF
ncbi:hypothetical protein D3C75_632900 [compost metagenome]